MKPIKGLQSFYVIVHIDAPDARAASHVRDEIIGAIEDMAERRDLPTTSVTADAIRRGAVPDALLK